jgi:CelD/BcsL family acetyltransferase involved in cellulose biosynthesis
MSRRVEIHSRVELIADEWDALADRVGANPWDRPGWISVWREAFGRGPARVLALRGDDGLAGVLPLEQVRGTLRAPTNWHTPSFAGVFANRRAAATLAEAALAEAPRHLELSFVDTGSALVQVMDHLVTDSGVPAHRRVIERSPYLSLPDSPEAFEATLSAKRRSSLRRLRRRLAERGSVAVEVSDGRERLDDLLAEGFAVERSGWKGERGTAIASQQSTRSFYTAIARSLAQRGWLRLAFLRLDRRAVAFDLAVDADGVHYLLKTGYEEAMRSLAPGLLLRHEMILRCVESGCASYEFLGSDAPWKREWTGTLRERLQLHAFDTTPAGRANWLVVARALPLARRVRDALAP